jgi:hypothetical protein
MAPKLKRKETIPREKHRQLDIEESMGSTQWENGQKPEERKQPT